MNKYNVRLSQKLIKVITVRYYIFYFNRMLSYHAYTYCLYIDNALNFLTGDMEEHIFFLNILLVFLYSLYPLISKNNNNSYCFFISLRALLAYCL